MPWCFKLMLRTRTSPLDVSAANERQRLHYPVLIVLKVLGSCWWYLSHLMLAKKQVLQQGLPLCHFLPCRRMKWCSGTRGLCSPAETPRPAACRGTGITQPDRSVLGNATFSSCSRIVLAYCTEKKAAEISNIRADWFWAQGEWAERKLYKEGQYNRQEYSLSPKCDSCS